MGVMLWVVEILKKMVREIYNYQIYINTNHLNILKNGMSPVKSTSERGSFVLVSLRAQINQGL